MITVKIEESVVDSTEKDEKASLFYARAIAFGWQESFQSHGLDCTLNSSYGFLFTPCKPSPHEPHPPLPHQRTPRLLDANHGIESEDLNSHLLKD